MKHGLPSGRTAGPSRALWTLAVLVLAAAGYQVDVRWLGLPLCGLLVCGLLAAVLLMVGVFRLARGRRRAGVWQLGRAALFLMFGLASFWACQSDVTHSAQRGRLLGLAVEAYRADQGRYPPDLAALRTAYLPVLPTTGSRWRDVPFHYLYRGAQPPILIWPIHILDGWAAYDFEQDRTRIRAGT